MKEFLNLLLNGETVEDAMKTSGIGKMQMIDILREIAHSEYVEEMSGLIAGIKEIIQTVRELDNALVDLKKS